MITEGIISAVDQMIDLCKDENQRLGMSSLREMLCDYDDDQWAAMDILGRADWLNQYLSC